MKIPLQEAGFPSLAPIDVDQLHALDAALHSREFITVRRRIFRQLIESLIYEGVLVPEVEKEKGGDLLRLHGREQGGTPVTYRCRARRRFSFDRVRLDPKPVVRVRGGRSMEAQSLSCFLLEIQASLGTDPDRLVRFTEELEQTLLKDTLAQHRGRRERGLLRGRAYDDLESGLMEGHPYHPCYKSRIGFDYADHLAFGPEFAPMLRPIWLAARRDASRIAASGRLRPERFLKQELGEEVYGRFLREVRRRGKVPEAYVLIPVHPWQWRERVLPLFYNDLREDRLIQVGTAKDFYSPQQSIRTVANLTAPHKASLKLSLGIVNTSTSRILAPHTVRNAAPITDWLQRIAQEDSFLREELRPILLGEVVGVAYDPPRPDLLQPAGYGALSCIWRESVHPFLSEAEKAVPFNSLACLDRDGRPFITPWVEQVGLVPWVRRLLSVSILPVIHFLYAHGIALEAHAQNMILIHTDGMPQRVAFKDFHDGIRFAPALLAAPDLRPDLCPTPELHARVNRNSYIEAEKEEEVRDFVHDAFFFVNLSELALFLDEAFALPERRFWTLARGVIERYLRRFPALQGRIALFDLFSPTVQVEQLTKRRLFPETEPRLHRVRNPLAFVKGE
ncbi:IucA/IucC family protein [Candidatus Manganitrophus noduliformans]|uniref:IucA/IucC family siderophore biosynthesis protein n=1 Tax=Candidatus Manganitrophus noduliformans TaxID=2606439 RepID=A0A7X6DUG3_9BACT|nr:IucA/IucC family protein [Candidatus Manganitrophus noduliformans]NKE73559.1 IucA/IucC family siderophore biosynthesis protein [Candidatus Manganitrophus noduliformans]